MTIRTLVPLAIGLLACPSPPEDAAAGGGTNPDGTPNNTQGGEGGGNGGFQGSGGQLDETTGTMCNTSMDQQVADIAHDQAAVESLEGGYVTFSGTITCETCTSDLTLQATAPPEAEVSEGDDAPAIITRLTVSPGESYALKLPRADSRIVLELLGGDNGDWFGVKTDVNGSEMNSSGDLSGVDMNVSVCNGGTGAAPANAGGAGNGPAGPPPADGGDPPPPVTQ